MTAKPRFSVLLDDPEILATELNSVARAVAKALGEPVSDATQRLRYGQGILVRDVLAPYAREVGRGLARLGHGTFTVESKAGGFAKAPRPKRTATLELKDDGLELAVRFKPPRAFPWEQVVAIHAHALTEVSDSDEGEPIPRRTGNARSSCGRALLQDIRNFEDRQRVRVELGLDVLIEGPSLYRVSFDTPGIYSALEGRADNAWDNYVLLLESAVLKTGEGVLIPPSTRRLLSRHEFTDILFSKREELDNFNAWLMHAHAEGIRYGEAEDVDDESLHDEDEAVLVADANDAEDIDDDELDTSDGGFNVDSRDELDTSDGDLEDEDLEDEDAEDEDAEDTSDGEFEDDPLDTPDRGFDISERLTPISEEVHLEGAEDLTEEDLRDEDLNEADIADVMDHFDKTRRLEAKDVQAMIADARDIDELDESADPDAEDVKEALGFFEVSSGAWDVTKLGEAGATGDEAEQSG